MLLSILCVIRHLILASELECDLGDTMDWGKKWLVDFNGGKIHLVSFDQSNNNGSIDVKMDGLLNSIGLLTLILLLRLPPRKSEF